MSSLRPRRSLDDLDSQTLFSVAGKLHNVSSLASLSTTDVLKAPAIAYSKKYVIIGKDELEKFFKYLSSPERLPL